MQKVDQVVAVLLAGWFGQWNCGEVVMVGGAAAALSDGNGESGGETKRVEESESE